MGEKYFLFLKNVVILDCDKFLMKWISHGISKSNESSRFMEKKYHVMQNKAKQSNGNITVTTNSKIY